MDAEMSIQNRIPQIPSQAGSGSFWACVENMGSLPHPALWQKGKDMFRTVGKRTGRGGRNDHPLALFLIDVAGPHPFPQVNHFCPAIFTVLNARTLHQVKILLHCSNLLGQCAVWQLTSPDDVKNSLNVRFSDTMPRDARLGWVSLSVPMRDVPHNVVLGNVTTKLGADSLQHRAIVIPLVYIGLRSEEVVAVARGTVAVPLVPVIATNHQRTISKEKSGEFGHPSGVYGVSVNVINRTHSVSIPHVTVHNKLVSKVTDCHDLYSELTSGVGTYPVPEGLTRETFQSGFKGMVGGSELYDDSNITIDSSDDAKGGVFAGGKGGAILLVQGRAPWSTHRDEPSLGGGGKSIWLWDEQTRPLAA